jgi:hypothetical protein
MLFKSRLVDAGILQLNGRYREKLGQYIGTLVNSFLLTRCDDGNMDFRNNKPNKNETPAFFNFFCVYLLLL